MAIYNNVGGSFQKVNQVFARQSSDNKFLQKVWVHNGDRYILVKGRLLEKVWEVDLSTYGGASWDITSRKPHNNIVTHPIITSDGDLIGVVPYVIGNGTSSPYTSGRNALIKITKNGEISYFSNYNGWVKWLGTNGYNYIAQPIGLVKISESRYEAFNIRGIFYQFNSSGGFIGKWEETSWHTSGSSKQFDYNINNGWYSGVKACFDGSDCLYFTLTDDNLDSSGQGYRSAIYRIGVAGGSYWAPRRHHSGVITPNTLYDQYNSVMIDSVTRKGIAFFAKDSYGRGSLVVFDASCSFSSLEVTDVATLCLFNTTTVERPVAIKDGYVYTLVNAEGTRIYKRAISDLSLVWSAEIPVVYDTLPNVSEPECKFTHQPLPLCEDGGFMLPNGAVVYDDGNFLKGSPLFIPQTQNADIMSTIRSFTVDSNLGVGYMMCYEEHEKVCKIIKFKEVVK